MRTAAGVIVGYLFFALATLTLFAVAGQEPHESASLGFAFVATVYGMVMAFIGGLIAAAMARHQRASALVSALIAIAAVASLFSVPKGGSRMSMIAALVLMAPLALVGGWFYRRLTRSAMSRPA
jgi:hypothetical protein